MNINIQLKTFTLLCILHATNIGASAPAKSYEALAEYGQAVIPASLQAEIKRIEDLPDHKVLIEVLPYSLDEAEQYLRKNENRLKGDHHSLEISSAKHHRSELKFWVIKNELSLCPAGALKQTLQSKLNEAGNQCYAHRQEEIRCANCIVKNQPDVAYNFMIDRHNALAAQASILLARTQNLEKEKAQLQQREQALLAQLNGYQLLENGLQIEGVPNVPGGVKPKLKRSGSF